MVEVASSNLVGPTSEKPGKTDVLSGFSFWQNNLIVPLHADLHAVTWNDSSLELKMKGLSPSFFLQHGLRIGVRIEAHFVDVAVVREEVAVAFVELTSVGMAEPTKHHAVQRTPHQKI